MAKAKESTKSSNNTSGVQLATNKTIGWTSLPWRDLPTIAVSMPQSRFPHSLKITVCTLVSAFPFRRYPSIRRSRSVHTPYKMCIVTSPSSSVSLENSNKAHADRNCLVTPTFAVGDMVWLLHRHFATTRPFQLHNVFHVSLLEIYHPSRIPGRQPTPPPPVELSTSEEYEVDRILDSRVGDTSPKAVTAR